MDQPVSLDSENVYEVTVKGEIDLSWLTAFSEVGVHSEIVERGGYPSTLFTIATDQAGLVGLVRRLHGLGVLLVSIRRAPEVDCSVQT
jgi:hypothetical protein